ncbi:hypothetical protein SASPL_130880 [Salvia splendens]|uniref:Uncharacterized protein n=1 Tax=Salvia splendens TaxID=180675 RepID=A0A8X8X503_SALSN|nr:uncharacterized protein LOC121755467 [Salvia splendens]KAG6407880.1 hypothetical protein SASPL_130880 [Salvia splendens]
MYSFGSIFLASLSSVMLKILGLIHRHVYMSKSSLAEEEKGSSVDSMDESSVSFGSCLVAKNSKCQILSANNVSGFLEEPKAVGFVVQEFFVGSGNFIVGSDQIIASEIMGFEEKMEEFDQVSEKTEDFEQESNFSSPFYFKLLNPSFSVNQESSSEMEKIVSLEGVCGEKEEEEDFRAEGKMVDEEFCYEIELIPGSHSSSLDQESDAHQEMEKNDSLNWMGSFLDEADDSKSSLLDDDNHENKATFDDEEFIEMEPQLVKLSDDLDLDLERESDSSSSPSCVDANNSSQPKCWDSDDEDEDEDDGVDVLSQHQNLVQQMKMELKSCRIRGLPTISEDSETPKMIEDLRPLEIDHKIGYKDVMDGIQRFYKSYTEKMRKLDILNYQTSQAISFLQLKETEAFTAGKERANSVLPRFLAGKVRRVYADPMHKTISELHRDLEVVYVGQMCLSWEMLWWLDAKARELLEHDDEGMRSYNRTAEELQQFQVLTQRFMEDEQFEGHRIDNYVRSRCMIRSLLQVPTIKDDCAKTKEREERDDAITLETLVGIISETMVIFQEFVFGDKNVTNCGGLIAKVDDARQHGLLLEVVSSLDKKGRRMKEQMRGEKCIVRKLRKHQERGLEREMMAVQVDLRLVSRVLNLSRLRGDHLLWCQKKLNNINFVGKRLRRDACFLLFPC